MKKFRNLDKKWKELLFALSGFGPNLLMILMGAFFSDAVNPTALTSGDSTDALLQTIRGVSIVLPGAFSILFMIAKIFDGIIDIPLAAVTDNLKTKWGRRRLPIAICFIPMVVAYALCWVPISETSQLANTIWIICWAIVFFGTYTMNLIAFYGSLSTVCADEKQRLRVSSYKSFFDTITYIIVYALVPLILGAFNIRIDKLVFLLLPTMVTMLIPLFMIKEGEKFEKKAIAEGYDITPLVEEPKVGIIESIKVTFTNKPFLKWCLVNCCTFFGLQMFLVSMNALILGGMGMSSLEMAILNTCAFAPVPIMLYLFNKLKAKKGIRFAYQTCLISFAICILSFVFGSTLVCGTDKKMIQIIIGVVGGIIGSWAIGSFFMMPYMIPAQISSVEEKLTKKNHSAMYFAAQAVTTSIIGAVAGSLVYENIKMLFFSTEGGVVWAESEMINGILVEAKFIAAAQLGVDPSTVFNLGLLLVPIIVSVVCLLGFFLAFLMPKDYSPKLVAKSLGLEKEYNANRHLFNDEETKEPLFEDESLIVNVGLWVLSGSIFGFIWRKGIISSVNTFATKKLSIVHWIISILVPPYTAFILFKVSKDIDAKCKEYNIKSSPLSVLHIILCLMGLSVISYSMLQSKLNKLAKVINE